MKNKVIFIFALVISCNSEPSKEEKLRVLYSIGDSIENEHKKLLQKRHDEYIELTNKYETFHKPNLSDFQLYKFKDSLNRALESNYSKQSLNIKRIKDSINREIEILKTIND